MFASKITLATSSTVYNLFTLMQAAQTAAVPSCNQIIITADAANGGNVYLGDSTVSSSLYGAKMNPTASLNLGPATFNGLGAESIYLMPDTTNQIIEVIATRI